MPGTAQQSVVSRPTPHDVIARVPVRGVVAGASADAVVAEPPIDEVSTSPTVEDIVPARPGDRVGAGQTRRARGRHGRFLLRSGSVMRVDQAQQRTLLSARAGAGMSGARNWSR